MSEYVRPEWPVVDFLDESGEPIPYGHRWGMGEVPEEAHALGDRFRALRDELGLTLVVIEHHVPLIAATCDYCYCLESGALIAEGTPADVTAQPRVVESFLGRGTLEAVGS